MICGELGPRGWQVHHLLPPRLRLTARHGSPTAPTVGRLADADLAPLRQRHYGALRHALPRLRPRLAPRGGLRRLALAVRPIRGRRPRGVLRGLVKALLQLCAFGCQRGNASFIPVDDHPHRGLHLRRAPLPECGRQRWLIVFHRTSLSSFLALLQVWDVNGHKLLKAGSLALEEPRCLGSWNIGDLGSQDSSS